MSILRKVKVSWASVQAPNVQFEPCWEIQVHLDGEQAAALQAEAKALHPKGIKIKKDDNGELTFRFRRKVMKADGLSENSKPAVVDAKNKPMTDLIGNGSTCNVQYSFVAYENKFGKGVTNDLKGVQVLDLVAYGVQDGGEFGVEDEEGTTPKADNDSFNDDDF